LPPKLFPPSIHLNLRNHRKLLIVDESIAYAGGMNIGDDHTDQAGKRRRISDVHFSLGGPIVSDLAAVFRADWEFAKRTPTQHGDVPEVPDAGGARCRVIPDGPDEALDALALTIQAVIGAADASVDIMTPYFLPSRELLSAMQSAALRGVRVRIVLPVKNNLIYIHWANRNLLGELLRWGVEVFYQPAPFCHSKLLCVDGEYSLIGSANLDPRSLRLNFELGVEVFDEPLNVELRAHFDAVIADSAPVTLEQLSSRSVPVRLRDSFVSLFSPYL
jgi:cardiolipin synthase